MRTINALSLSYDDFEPEPIPSDGTMAHAVERLITLVCHDAGMRVAQSGQILASRLPRTVDPTRVLLIAHYRPQIDAENRGGLDNGTAEWTAVANAAPMFPNHRQPRLPADLGFYDLRLPEVRRAQADLARRYGIAALSYQLRWFSGRRRQERSPAELLASAIADFPFMVCWANDAESRDREGFSEAAQDYPPEWERRFAHDVAVLMRDHRYLRLNGRPVLAIQRVEDIPGPVHAMRRLRAALRKNGFPQVHLIGGWTLSGANEPSPAQDLYLDSCVEWPPCNLTAQLLNRHEKPSGSLPRVYDYSAVVEAKLDELAAGSDARRYRAVMTGWDDTARKGREGSVFHGATPTNFRRWLRAAVERSRAEATDRETLVFINAWNDWATGAYLEPDRDFGHGWLEAVALAADQRAIAEYELWGSPS